MKTLAIALLLVFSAYSAEAGVVRFSARISTKHVFRPVGHGSRHVGRFFRRVVW